MLSEALTLAPDIRAILSYSTKTPPVWSMSLALEDDISAPAVGKMRLTLFNAVTDKQVSLVDVGQYTARRTLCEDSLATR